MVGHRLRNGAETGDGEINLRAARLLNPNGLLISCSCSFQMSGGMLLDILSLAAADAKRQVRLLETRAQSLDHPIVLTHPESKYLKCFILEVM